MPVQLSRRTAIARVALFAGLPAVLTALQACGVSQTADTVTSSSAGAAAGTGTSATGSTTAAAAAASTVAATPTPIRAEAGKGATVINFWNGLTGSDGQGMVRIVQRYAQDNPNVTVKIQMIAWRTFYDKLSASLVAGDPPEMWIQHSEDVIRYDSKGLMKPLDELASSSSGGIPISDMGYTLPFAKYQGKLYSIPLDQYTWCVMYNKDLVKAAGLDPDQPPKTGDDFKQWGVKLTLDKNGKHPGESGFDVNNIKQWGFYFNLDDNIWYTLRNQLGLPPMISGPDATDVNTDAPESVKALEEMVSWTKTLGFVPAPSGVTVMDGFWAGKVAMTYNGVWETNDIKAHPDVKTGIAITPVWYGNDPKVTFSGHQMAMPASNKDKVLEEAWKTIKYISDHTLDWAKEGQTPARKSILNSDEFKALWPQSVYAQQLPTGVPLQPHPKLIELSDLAVAGVDAALNGQKTPAQALKETAQRQRQVLARKD